MVDVDKNFPVRRVFAGGAQARKARAIGGDDAIEFPARLRFLEQANAGQPAYFMGHYSHAGWWAYFPVSFLIKTPIGTLVVIAASLALYRMGAPLSRRDAIFLLSPVAVVFLVSAQAKTNIGLRHVLVVYPLLFVLAF